MDFSFLGGSMGSVVGEKLARAADRCVERGPAAGRASPRRAAPGCRRACIALMQMAKTVVAFELMHDAELPVIVVLVHPTTGGVWASFASIGDVTYAEPGALIAFSGPARDRADHARDAAARVRPRRDPARQRARSTTWSTAAS